MIQVGNNSRNSNSYPDYDYIGQDSRGITVIGIKLRIDGESSQEQITDWDIAPPIAGRERSPFYWASRGDRNSTWPSSIRSSENFDTYDQVNSVGQSPTPIHVGAQKISEEFRRYLRDNPPSNSSIENPISDSLVTEIKDPSDNCFIGCKFADNIRNRYWGNKAELEDTIKKAIEYNKDMKGFRKRLEIFKNITDPMKYALLEGMDLALRVKHHAEAADSGLHDLIHILKSIAESPKDIPKIVESLKNGLKGVPKDLPGRFTYFSSQIAASLLAFHTIQMAGKTAVDIASEFHLSEAGLRGSKRIVDVFQKAGAAGNAPGPLTGGAVQAYSQVDQLLQLLQMKFAFGSLFPGKGRPPIQDANLPETREVGSRPEASTGSLYSGSIEEIIEQANLSPEYQEILSMASLSKDIALSASEAVGLGVPEKIIINDLNEAIKLSIDKNKPHKALEYYFNKVEIRKYNVINNVDPAQGEKLAEKGWSHQNHHIGTDKHSEHTEKINEIYQKYNIDIKRDPLNIIRIPHVGPHCDLYHDWIFLNLENIDYIAQGNREIFEELFETNIRDVIRKDPLIIHRDGWPR